MSSWRRIGWVAGSAMCEQLFWCRCVVRLVVVQLSRPSVTVAGRCGSRTGQQHATTDSARVVGEGEERLARREGGENST